MSSKKKFGIPHRKYGSSSKLCAKVKKCYDKFLRDPMVSNRNIVSKLAKKFIIPRTTVWRWVKRWRIDDNYDPSDMSVHGRFNRIFTDEQEKNLSEHIIEVYLKTNRYFPDFAFQSFTFEFFDEIYKDTPDPPEFNCSAGFISDFKNRNRFSSRLSHFRQRPLTKSQIKIQKELDDFRSLVTQLINDSKSSD